ncbi:ABC transporter permease, partial [Staphylococcus arlettae]
FGHGEIFSPSRISYLCLAFILFTFQFLSFTAIVSLIAILTEDSGKTILFTLVIAILMLAVEKLSSGTFVELLYQQTVFSQFNVAFKYNISSDEVLHSIVIGGIWGIILLLLNIFTLKHKEIK